MKWTKLYEYYDTIFGQNNFSGGEKHRDRNFKIAETLAMCRGAEFAYNPAHLPDLAEGVQTLPGEFQEQPCFYTARAIKGDKDYEMKETVFTRVKWTPKFGQKNIKFANEFCTVQDSFLLV